jgi:hypothetical protein
MKYLKTFEGIDRSIEFAKFKVGDYAKIRNKLLDDKVKIVKVKHSMDDRNRPLIYKIENLDGEDLGWAYKGKLIKLNGYEISRLKLKLAQNKYNI